MNSFVLHIATVNGSGSQSSNNILVRSLFRMGLNVGGKNLFPSNIQGLPTWFTIRVHSEGFVSRQSQQDILVCMNPSTFREDLNSLKPGGVLIYNEDFKIPASSLRQDIQIYSVPFKDLISGVTDSVKLKKLLVNMAYVGVLAELLEIDETLLKETISSQFSGKEGVAEVNKKAIEAGQAYARENLNPKSFPFKVQKLAHQNKDKILIDGNTASALGLLYGGCSFVSWYPITPSSSLVESFESYANKYAKDSEGNHFAVVQAEDELASIAMVIGAGWSGARAATATSGPGLSLMAEAAGLAYYAEIPSVIWDVQRVGPSTGLPTRTMQGDLISAYYLSHGDSKHVLLLPGTVEECFEFGQVSLDLAERLQTLVIVLSDLDLGMNFHSSPRFQYPTKPYDRGKVLRKEDLERLKKFARYEDVDGDGISYRTLPGTEHELAAYFTRGTGHNSLAQYSEKPEDYKANMDRLQKKWETARKWIPAPEVDMQSGEIGLVAYGSTHLAIPEIRHELRQNGITSDYLRPKGLPLSLEIRDFIEKHERVYLIEQNRDAQFRQLLLSEWPELASRVSSILEYDGLPLEPRAVVDAILAKERR